MSRLLKIIFVLVSVVSAMVLLASCDSIPIPGREDIGSNQRPSDPVVVNIDATSSSNTPISPAPAIPILLIPEASGTLVEQNERALLDFSNKEDGYIMVRWLTETDMQLRVRVTGPTGVFYTYRLWADDQYEVFPLSDGSGQYSVMVLEQVEGTNFALALEVTFDVQLADEFGPFLRPNQYVNFNENSNVVAVAAQLVAGQETLLDKIASVYNFVATHITYDAEFAQKVVDGYVTGYIPDLDDVIARGYGICFDYAAVMTAMLRSQGIPTKMIFGYVGDVYHAWINVHSEETGWINGVILFDGHEWTLMDPTFESTAGNAAALQEFIGDGSNYIVKFLF
ncbi:MAG: transglutaminase domain-containing protein [Oscillospiraceae bacterium]|nr:transglutaminase domain-containing protein [Oscillospiraceae bacterium]